MHQRHPTRPLALLPWMAVFLIAPTTASSQVMITPNSITPAGWAHFEISVVNSRDDAITGVRVVVPEIISILGVDPTDDWTYESQPAAGSAPQFIEWTGSTLSRGDLATFSFLGRLAGDAKKRSLLFPMTITRGSDVQEINARESGVLVQIIGSTILTPWAGLGVAALAFAVSMVAVGLAAWKGAERQS